MAPTPSPHTLSLSARGLTLRRGPLLLFEGIGFELPPASALLLRGPNGSGKSTLLRALLGLTPLQAGELSLNGERFSPDTGALRPHALWLGHAGGIKAELTALENLSLMAGLDGGQGARAFLRDALARVGLGRALHVEARRLSQGQRQRLTLARLLVSPHRRLWLLDEPSAALDQAGSDLLDGLLDEHLHQGGSALIATHLPVLARRDPPVLMLPGASRP
ncbi:MAG: heme ABC exporter ATP-binding protein CcmA [Lautropia sp.]|nr:heme ABC exporter ATP-binding protein CcmA [Lautropia sp.]